MWRVSWMVLALVVTTLAFPKECTYISGEEDEYECPISDGSTLIIKTMPDDYVKIDCQGGSLSCANIPRLKLSHNGTLNSMSVKHCALTDALSCTLTKLGARAVTTLSLWSLRTPLRVEHVRGLSDIENLLMFESGVERSIPMEVLSSLPSLREYRLRQAHVELAQFPALQLRLLELMMDDISELPPGVFQQLNQLTMLNLQMNKYRHVSNQSFTGLTSLEFLGLSPTTQSIDPGTFAPTPNLKGITMTRANLEAVQQGVFTGHQHLEKILISNDIKLTIESRAFAALPSLTDVKLDRATIHSLPSDAFSGSSAITNLSLAFNKLEELPSTLFKDQTGLQRLNLENNNIKALPADLFAKTKKLVVLNLDSNYIEVLPGRLFAGLSNLDTVTINNNRLKTIADDAFRGARNLHTIRLSNNQLTLLPESNANATATDTNVHQYQNLMVQSPFGFTYELQFLDLSRNQISIIFDDWTTTLVQLRSLDLSYNRLSSLNAFDTQFLTSNIVLNLQHNNISTVDINNSMTLDDPDEPSSGVALLEHNPLHCDCHLYGVVQLWHGYYNKIAKIKLDFGDATCVSPQNLVGTRISSLKPEQLICTVTIDCPDGCQCFVRLATSTLELVCGTENVAIPPPDQFGVQFVQLQLLNTPSFINTISSNVSVLKLNELGMTELPKGRPSNSIKEIDLRKNALRHVPVELIKMNLQLSLSGNPFDCVCRHVEELDLLIKYRKNIKDFDNVICSDGLPVSSLDTRRLCSQLMGAIIGGSLAVLGLLVALIAVILYRYSLEVRVWLFARGWCRCLLPEERLDRDKQYDAFLSFAHGDEEFVQKKLLPILDNEYRVCVHYRDWVVGDMIPTQIARSVETSRRTVIVLSHKFLESIWAKLEFRAAHMQALSDRRARVIVILLQDVTANEKLDDELKAYLNTNTYVKWDDPWFWDKLRYVLPRSGAKQRVEEIRAERKTREALDKFMSYGLDVYLNEEGKLINATAKP